MTEGQTSAPSHLMMTREFIRRPGWLLGPPIRFDRVTAFIAGYTHAIHQVRTVLVPGYADDHHPPGIEMQFQAQLRKQGRLRWDRWDLTIAAEAIGWTGDEPPVVDQFSDEQHRAAIAHLEPLLERMYGLSGSFRSSQREDS